MFNKVLVVQEDEIKARDLIYCLEYLGYNVIDAVKNGNAAIKSVINKRPDLIVLDIDVGDINTIEAAIKFIKCSIPIVYCFNN